MNQAIPYIVILIIALTLIGGQAIPLLLPLIILLLVFAVGAKYLRQARPKGMVGSLILVLFIPLVLLSLIQQIPSVRIDNGSNELFSVIFLIVIIAGGGLWWSRRRQQQAAQRGQLQKGDIEREFIMPFSSLPQSSGRENEAAE